MAAKPGAWAVARCAVTHWGKDDAATIGAATAGVLLDATESARETNGLIATLISLFTPLFHVGRWAIALYLGHATQPTAFGAAASFVALLLWFYYSAQIFLLGAEFTACIGGTRKGEKNAR